MCIYLKQQNNKKMTTERLYELFKLNNSKGRDSITPNAAFINEYGNVSFEEAFIIYLESISWVFENRKKINEFEAFLIAQNITPIKSNVSESRYYYYEGNKYRFSGHIYPTGSMTDLEKGVYDLGANPELIKEITF